MRGEQRPVDVVVETAFEQHHSVPVSFTGSGGCRLGARHAAAGHTDPRSRTASACGVGGGGSGRPSFFAKNVSMMCCAIGARSEPCSPCSTKMTPAISGLSRGAKKTNQPWSRRSLPDARRGGASLVRDHLRRAGLAGHVVPVDARAAAGAAAVHDHPQPVVNRLQLLRLEIAPSTAAAAPAPASSPLPSSTALSRCGVTRVPPLASVAI